MIIMFGVPLYHHHSNRCAHHEYQQVSCALCGWPMFLWISITTFPIIPIIIIIIIIINRFHVLSVVGRCVVRNVHKGAHTLSWSVISSGIVMMMIMI